MLAAELLGASLKAREGSSLHGSLPRERRVCTGDVTASLLTGKGSEIPGAEGQAVLVNNKQV